MIYIDTSVALAHLLAEKVSPPESLWEESLISSRLLEYEVWVRLGAQSLGRSHSDAVRQLLARIALIELAPPVLARASEPFPITVRTLDALHLASIEFIRAQGQPLSLASYDERMLAAARRIRIPIAPI